MLSFNAIETFHPDDREEALLGIQRIMVSGEEEIAEGRVLLLHGGSDYLWLLMMGHRVIIDGEPFLIGTGVDHYRQKKSGRGGASA